MHGNLSGSPSIHTLFPAPVATISPNLLLHMQASPLTSTRHNSVPTRAFSTFSNLPPPGLSLPQASTVDSNPAEGVVPPQVSGPYSHRPPPGLPPPHVSSAHCIPSIPTSMPPALDLTSTAIPQCATLAPVSPGRLIVDALTSAAALLHLASAPVSPATVSPDDTVPPIADTL